MKPVKNTRPKHWQAVAGVLECTRCGFHAFVVLEPHRHLEHPTKFRVYTGPGQTREDAAIADSIEWGVAFALLGRDHGIAAMPDLELIEDSHGWTQDDTDDLSVVLRGSDLVSEVLEQIRSGHVEVPGGLAQVAVNAPGGEA